MKKSTYFIFTLTLVMLFTSPLYAGYHMNLVAEFALPENDCWDVQHWTSDSTYGWVTAQDNEITYCLDINNPSSATFAFTPDDIGFPFMRIEHIKIYGSDSNAGLLPTIAVLTRFGQSYGLQLLNFARVVVTAQQELLPNYGSEFLYNTGYDDWWASSTIGRVLVWPPPPSSTATLLWSRSEEYSWNGAGSYGMNSSTLAYGFKLTGNTDTTCIGRMYTFSPFTIYDSLTVAGEATHTSFICNDVMPPEVCSHRSSAYRTCFLPDTVITDTVCYTAWEEGASGSPCLHLQHAAAQVSADGSRRAFFGTDTCFAVSDGQLVPAWTNPDIVDGKRYTATLHDSPDERLLVHRLSQPSIIDVFDAENGEFLGRLSGMSGRFQYVLKQPSQVSKFVTYDNDTNIIRIYEPSGSFTISVLPATNSLQFNWHPVTGATSYTVWLRHPAPLTGPYFVGTTTDTTMTIPIPGERVGYFNVEVNY